MKFKIDNSSKGVVDFLIKTIELTGINDHNGSIGIGMSKVVKNLNTDKPMSKMDLFYTSMIKKC